MIFKEISIAGAYVVDIEKIEDARGSFARMFCKKEFTQLDLETNFVQENISVNNKAGTIRGMHYQKNNCSETKLVRCTHGEIFDVLVDLRPDSPSYLRWFGVELTAENCSMLYVPVGCAHGYQALTDGAVVHYMVSNYYEPGSEGGLHYKDPVLGITWPREESEISEKDKNWPMIQNVTGGVTWKA